MAHKTYSEEDVEAVLACVHLMNLTHIDMALELADQVCEEDEQRMMASKARYAELEMQRNAAAAQVAAIGPVHEFKQLTWVFGGQKRCVFLTTFDEAEPCVKMLLGPFVQPPPREVAVLKDVQTTTVCLVTPEGKAPNNCIDVQNIRTVLRPENSAEALTAIAHDLCLAKETLANGVVLDVRLGPDDIGHSLAFASLQDAHRALSEARRLLAETSTLKLDHEFVDDRRFMELSEMVFGPEPDITAVSSVLALLIRDCVQFAVAADAGTPLSWLDKVQRCVRSERDILRRN